jgi:PAS domain S-box-containing protein
MGGAANPTATSRPVVFWFWFGLKAIVLFVLYVASAKAGLRLEAVGNYAAPVWPPTGIAVACVFLWGDAFVPVIFLATAAVNFTVGDSVPIAFALGLGNAGEAFVAVTLLRQFGFRPTFERVRDVLVFVICAGTLSPLVSATVGVTSLWLAGLDTAGYLATWIPWWVGDALGAIVVAPVILAFASLGRFRLPGWRKIEAPFLLVAILLVDYALFILTPLPELAALFLLSVYVLFGWTAIRYEVRGAALATLFTCAIAVTGAILHHQTGSLVILEAFLATIAVPHLLIGASNADRRQNQAKIVEMNRDLVADVQRQVRVIEETAERDEAILAGIGDGVIAVDTERKITHINPAAQAMLGLESRDLVGIRYDKIFDLTDGSGKKVPTASRPMYITMKSGHRFDTPVGQKYFYSRLDGTRFPVSVTVTPILLYGRMVGAVQVFRDVTVEQGIERAKSEFVALASHQLRTPLTAVRWYADALADMKKGDKDSVVAEIRRNVARMAATVSTILDVSKIEVGGVVVNAAAVDVVPLVRNAIQGIAVQADLKGLTIRFEPDNRPVLVSADATLLKAVLENLLSNALKYSRPGGTIDIKAKKAGARVEISVADKGIGIAKPDQKKLFTKFFRADNARLAEPDGNGLGLYLTRNYVERMGGKLQFESVLGKGTTFFVTLRARARRG